MQSIRELDLSSCKLRDFEKMFDQSKCPNLKELNLNHNFLSSMKGFGFMPQLKILKLKSNRIESLFCKPKEGDTSGYPPGMFGLFGLEFLDVSNNSLTDLFGLQFAKLKELRVMYAAGNEIQKVGYIDKLVKLRELDLSKNKIRSIDPSSFP